MRSETIWLTCCAIVIGALLLWNASTSLYMMWVGTSPLPFHDQWDASLLPDQSIQYLFAFSNEHRPALARLLGWLDWYLAGARNGVNATFIALCYPAIGLALLKLVHMIVGDWRRAGLYSALALSFMVSAEQWENLLWGFQTAFVGSFAFAFIALASASYLAKPMRSVAGTAITAFVCLVASLFAVFSLASGLLSLIFVAIYLFVIGVPKKLKYGYLIFAIAVLGFYFHGYASPSLHSNPLTSVRHVLGIGLYVFEYLGAPFAVGTAALATVIGELGLLLLIIVVASGAITLFDNPGLRSTERGAAYIALLFFALFIATTAGITALGRLNFGIEQAMTSRYGTPALAFWGTLIALYLVQPYVSTGTATRLIQWGGAILGTVLACYVAKNQLSYIPMAREMRAAKFSGAIAYIVGLRNYPVVMRIYPNPPLLAKSHLDVPMQRLREARKSIFARELPYELGTRFTQQADAVHQGCRGYIDKRMIVRDQSPVISEVQGWAWDEERKKGPDLIVFTDVQGLIVGYAGLGLLRSDVPHVFPIIRSNYTGWYGFVRADTTMVLHAYGVVFGKSSRVCEFATSPSAL